MACQQDGFSIEIKVESTTPASRLVQWAQKGNSEAFGELVRRYRPRIYALALHLTGRAEDADDVTQDAFVRAFCKLDSFQGKSEFSTWIYRIAVHRAFNLTRDRKRRRGVDTEDPRIEAALVVDGDGDPRRELALRTSYAELLAAFDRLSPILRTTVALVTLQGLNHKQAAEVLDSTEGTIAWRVHEARSQLRRVIEELSHHGAEEKWIRTAQQAYRAQARHGYTIEQLLHNLFGSAVPTKASV